ncbi:MAG: metallophosphoesterase family protein [Pseudomonadota bacterium]
MEAALPSGLRLYAIGDVHGCHSALTAIHHLIRSDLAARPVPEWRVLHLGDYIDRGPDSRAVVVTLRAKSQDPRWVCLRGNHDQYLIDVLESPGNSDLINWISNGGSATLAAYGMAPVDTISLGDPAARLRLCSEVIAAVPDDHRAFLRALPYSARFGGYLFVHAGIRPGRPIGAQDPHDLMWIRRAFLNSTEDHGAVVVHGHSVVDRVERHPNRIAIDTGAVFGGSLSCLVLEAGYEAVLTGDGPVPLEAVWD